MNKTEPNGTGIMSEATKQKMSKSHIGKKDSEETKQKKSQSAFLSRNNNIPKTHCRTITPHKQ